MKITLNILIFWVSYKTAYLDLWHVHLVLLLIPLEGRLS